jgi:hypothetical protein
LDIYVLRTFQWYEFWPLKSLFEDSGIHQDSNSKNGNPLRNVWVPSLALSCTPKSVNVTLRLHSQLAPFHAFALVTNLRLGSWHVGSCFKFLNFRYTCSSFYIIWYHLQKLVLILQIYSFNHPTYNCFTSLMHYFTMWNWTN